MQLSCLVNVSDYLLEQQRQVRHKSREWWAYLDAYQIVEDALNRVNDEYEQQWKTFFEEDADAA